jgi:hypothetical protein
MALQCKKKKKAVYSGNNFLNARLLNDGALQRLHFCIIE